MVTGWITNKGNVIECRVYEHFNTNDITIKKIWCKYEEELNESYKSHVELSENGEHPEWHSYEIFENECKNNAYKEIYELGYLRISKYDNEIAIEGYGQYIANNKQLIDDLSDKYNCKVNYFRI